jgi:hypothetical protein
MHYSTIWTGPKILIHTNRKLHAEKYAMKKQELSDEYQAKNTCMIMEVGRRKILLAPS